MGRILKSSNSHLQGPPLDDGLHLPDVYDWQYANNPAQTAFLYSTEDSKDIQNITYNEFVPAIHRAGRLVSDLIKNNDTGYRKDSPVVAVLSAADTVSIFTNLIGMFRAGVICFPISPRFSAPVVAHLLERAGVTDVLVDQYTPRLYQIALDALLILDKKGGIEKSLSLPNVHALPLYDNLYGNHGVFEPLPRKTYSPTSTAMIVHSSNSSSEYPKAIPWTFRLLQQSMAIPAKSSHDLHGVVFSCHSIELFHPIGLHFLFWVPVYTLKLAVFKPSFPATIPTSELTFRGMRETKSQYVVTHTRFLEEWWQDKEKLAFLTTLQSVIYGGKLLKQSAGDHLAAQGVKLCILYGSTESGLLSAMPSGKIYHHQLLPLDSFIREYIADDQGLEWEYFQLNPQCAFEFVDQGDGSSHAVVMPGEEFQSPILNSQHNGKDACSTGDLLVPHPTKPGHWKVIGRLDDQTMLLTGEVVNPVRLENILCESPHINSAVIFGRSRICLGVLIELSKTIDARDPHVVDEARNLVWPTVKIMNASASPNCRISRHMIIFVQADKPLVYNPKGYPKRPAALVQYQNEIDVCYKGFHDPYLMRDLISKW